MLHRTLLHFLENLFLRPDNLRRRSDVRLSLSWLKQSLTEFFLMRSRCYRGTVRYSDQAGNDDNCERTFRLIRFTSPAVIRPLALMPLRKLALSALRRQGVARLPSHRRDIGAVYDAV